MQRSVYMKLIIVPTPLFEAEAWGTRSGVRRKMNVRNMKCLRPFASRMYKVSNEVVRRRNDIERELASKRIRVYLDGLDTWRKWMTTVWQQFLMTEVSGDRYGVDRG